MAKKKSNAGRPSKFDPKYCEMLIEEMGKGFSYEAFAGIINTCIQTLYNWEKEHPEFLEAKKQAFQKSRLFWEQLAVDNIINKTDSESWEGGGSSKSRSLNSTVWIFNMKNRFGWRDKQPDEDSVNVTVNLADKLSKARARAKKVK